MLVVCRVCRMDLIVVHESSLDLEVQIYFRTSIGAPFYFHSPSIEIMPKLLPYYFKIFSLVFAGSDFK